MTHVEAIQDAIRTMHGCNSRHLESIPVHEMFRGKVAWKGVVEVFALEGHPQAQRCYAWGYTDHEGRRKYVTVLELPPVDSAAKAVRAYVIEEQSESKRSD